MSQDDKERRGLVAPLPSTEELRHKEDWIGRQLRRVFDDALNEPMPDDIMSLLERIEDDPGSRGEPGKGAV
ncbi:NepR family anti-sigma factor [Kaistia algarum]|uniref:NepR family anti-sigma factor n=1 Tax=Kaistia algarum TaxID=2083279 RepID=UPI001057490F|nr:NepR family anti-sigma factor [Kaistia algarum]MCX5513532.1 NepR family anti-sigma factor [Kaistia algarum]